MTHPFLSLSAGQRARLFWFFLALTALVMLVMRRIDVPLQTAAAPQGIISFEFAGTLARAEAIVASWDAQGRAHAGFSLGFDYLFMLAYAVTIALACLWAREWLGALARLGVPLAWAMGLAALLDAVENVGLWRLLNGGGDPWPGVAQISAAIKFGLIGLAILYALAGLIVRALRRN